MKSGYFIGNKNVENNPVTGMSFNSNTVISFIAYITVTTGIAAELFTATGLYSIATGSWTSFDLTSTGDISGVSFNLTSNGQLEYTSNNNIPTFRWMVQQIIL
jgi:hypothetical protein